MTKLRILLSYNYLYFFLLVLLLFRIFLNEENVSEFVGNEDNFTCIVLNITKGEKNKYELECIEKLIGYSEEEYEIGDILELKGNLIKIEEEYKNDLFNYMKYYNRQGIFYRLMIRESNKKGESLRVQLLVKKLLFNRIEKMESFTYLNSLILGNKDNIDREIMSNYEDMGIVHIFSISGMHLGLLILVLEKIFKKTSKIYLFIVLFIYYQIIGSVSILRSIIYFLLKFSNEKLFLNLSKLKIIFILVFLILFINPNYIYNIGFYFSTIISSSIILFSNKKLLPLVVFLMSFPLNLYLNSEINILSILYNFFIIPLFTFIIYPLSLLTLIFSFLDIYFVTIIRFLEFTTKLISTDKFTIIMNKPSVTVVIYYYLITILILYKRKYYWVLLLSFFIHYNYNQIFPSSYLLALDVKDGDSFLIHHENLNILIDTGGNNYDILNNITLPILKSRGIRKIDLLIITHGDIDHAKEASKLIESFKVEKVYLNNNEVNNIEEEIINKSVNNLLIDKKVIEGNDFKINLRSYDNSSENDSSILCYIEIKNTKMLFMGDASKNIEERFVKEANIKEIDILKVSHHGSKTSTSEEVINKINPKYSIISVGKNNRYGHPNDSVLDNLENSQIYRTDKDGSIMLKIKNNKLEIETCAH